MTVTTDRELTANFEGRFHPADLDQNWRLSMAEAIAYLAGWQRGENLMAIAIRAAYLWQHGETYTYKPDQDEPLCWQPGVQ